MKIIPLSQGYSTRVDDADFDRLMQWKWCAFVNNCARNIVYAVRGRRKDDEEKTSLIFMHLARISIKKRDVRIGTYKTIEEAARAYDAAAIKEFGEFAQLNFPLATLRA